jgi:hypothetical protein
MIGVFWLLSPRLQVFHAIDHFFRRNPAKETR